MNPPMDDLARSFLLSWQAIRLRFVATGAVLPVEGERFDLLLLWALRLR